MDGVTDDPEVTIYGDLVVPKKAKGPVPALVYVHGSSGKRTIEMQWVGMFQKMGFATLRLDCFKGRKIRSTVGKHTTVTGVMMTVDAFKALEFLSKDPRIDKDKIGIMGRSKGGGVTVNTAWEPSRQAVLGDDLKFAFHIPLYPPCPAFELEEYTGAPILFLLGAIDDYTPPEPCLELAKSMEKAGVRAEVGLYENAYHSFDTDHNVNINSKAWNLTKCRFKVTEEGVMIEETSGITLGNPKDKIKALKACGTKGPHTGGNRKARAQAKKDVASFIKSLNLL